MSHTVRTFRNGQLIPGGGAGEPTKAEWVEFFKNQINYWLILNAQAIQALDDSNAIPEAVVAKLQGYLPIVITTIDSIAPEPSGHMREHSIDPIKNLDYETKRLQQWYQETMEASTLEPPLASVIAELIEDVLHFSRQIKISVLGFDALKDPPWRPNNNWLKSAVFAEIDAYQKKFNTHKLPPHKVVEKALADRGFKAAEGRKEILSKRTYTKYRKEYLDRAQDPKCQIRQ